MKKLFMIAVLFLVFGCGGTYVPPDACTPDAIENSRIMKLTQGNPATLGKIIKTGVVIGAAAQPQQVAQVNIILDTVENFLNQDNSYSAIITYLRGEIGKLNVQYTQALLVWLPSIDPLLGDKNIINECDKALILKNIGEVRRLINQ